PLTAPTDIHPLSLHDALPIYRAGPRFTVAGDAPIPFLMPDRVGQHILYPILPEPFQYILHSGFGIQPVIAVMAADRLLNGLLAGDRKSTRLNSSHVSISYAVF